MTRREMIGVLGATDFQQILASIEEIIRFVAPQRHFRDIALRNVGNN